MKIDASLLINSISGAFPGARVIKETYSNANWVNIQTGGRFFTVEIPWSKNQAGFSEIHEGALDFWGYDEVIDYVSSEELAQSIIRRIQAAFTYP